LEGKFDFEYVIIGIIFLLTGISILYIRVKTYKVNENIGGFKYNSIGGTIILFMLAIYLIYNEIVKIL
jgi:NADH:ubiquinone oxidoreductase subunit 3 (subunit A)